MPRSSLVGAVSAVLLLLACAPAAAARSAAQPHSQPTPPAPLPALCAPLEGHGSTSGVANNLFAGTVADLVIGGEKHPAWVTTTLLHLWFATDRTVRATASHVYEIRGNNDGTCDEGEDCFETTGQTVASPSDGTPGLFVLSEHSRITGGNGAFADACGMLVLHGRLDLNAEPPSADWLLRGRVCRCN